jgi:hypothetical protein
MRHPTPQALFNELNSTLASALSLAFAIVVIIIVFVVRRFRIKNVIRGFAPRVRSFRVPLQVGEARIEIGREPALK